LITTRLRNGPFKAVRKYKCILYLTVHKIRLQGTSSVVRVPLTAFQETTDGVPLVLLSRALRASAYGRSAHTAVRVYQFENTFS